MKKTTKAKFTPGPRYEIDHVGPRDFRVMEVSSGKPEWCQTYDTRRQAEAGIRAILAAVEGEG